MTIREALLSMGYSECKPGRWLKPIGYQCFSFQEEMNRWENWFTDVTGKISLWDSKHFEHELERFGSYLNQLKYFECWTRTDMYGNSRSEFHLRGIDL